MARTKIVCTIGPSSRDKKVLKDMIAEGMNVARLNFSHGSHGSHASVIEQLRSFSDAEDTPVAILQDLCGPKIRVGAIDPPGIRLEPGDTLTLTNQSANGGKNRVSVSYAQLPQDVEKGDVILLADGMMELDVLRTTDTDIECRVVIGGVLTSHKGINLPSGTIRAPALTDKDKEDLKFGLSQDVDFVALSFVRRPEHIFEARELIRRSGRQTPLIAKIEKHEAVKNMDAIIAAADGIMVARGDLGVEIPLERVPEIQKQLVRKANAAGKPVIIATQMLRSMVDAPRPTRAEATDVANAVLDGTDAVMLSEETASGAYPVASVSYMHRIAKSSEESYTYEKSFSMITDIHVSESVAHAACTLADHLKAAAIVASTQSGFTAAQISRFRPRSRIIALSPDRQTVRRLCLYWGCMPSFVPRARDVDEMLDAAVRKARETGHVKEGDLLVITAGHPLWEPGTTNMIKVRQI
ncbi:MAG: pyruvate kinase [Desulfosalsimonadaceae bacterium]